MATDQKCEQYPVGGGCMFGVFEVSYIDYIYFLLIPLGIVGPFSWLIRLLASKLQQGPQVTVTRTRSEVIGNTCLRRLDCSALLPHPKGPCSQIDIHRPQSTQIGTTLRPKYIYLDTWTLRVRYGDGRVLGVESLW